MVSLAVQEHRMQKMDYFCLTGGVSMRPHLKAFFHLRYRLLRFLVALMGLFCLQRAAAADDPFVQLQLLKPGDHTLHILSPNVLELFRVNSKQPNPARVDSWDWVTDQGAFAPPN